MKSKLLLSLLFVSGVVGCSSAPKEPPPITIKWEQTPMAKLNVETPKKIEKPIYELRNYEGPEVMENAEVIALSRACISVQLRPKITYLSIRTDSGALRVPVGVACENW
jgi:hypothetical protein